MRIYLPDFGLNAEPMYGSTDLESLNAKERDRITATDSIIVSEGYSELFVLYNII